MGGERGRGSADGSRPAGGTDRETTGAPGAATRGDRAKGAGSAAGSDRPSTGRLTAEELGFPERVACVFCEGDDTELHSPFGSALSVATYWCNRCRTAFEWVKRDGR